MAPGKQYGVPTGYEQKLKRVIVRLGAELVDFNWDRHGGWVQFKLKGEIYQFDHSVAKAKAHGVKLQYGSDAFAQIVLALEDLARLSERGIYDLQVWVSGIKYLPPPKPLPWWAPVLGMDKTPTDEAEIKAAYRERAKVKHPDAGGSQAEFIELGRAQNEALAWLKEGSG